VFDVRSRRVAVALVTLVAGGALAACGSSSSGSATSSTTAAASSGSSSGSGTSTTGGGPNSARRAQLVSCLKSHGVTLLARPAGAGAPPGGGAPPAGGGSGTGTTGTSTTSRRGFFFGGGGARNISPKLQAAFKACGANFGFRGGAGGFRGRISHTAITSFVTCVNQHGYKLPSPNFSGKGPIFPQSIESNAKFQAAAKACQHLLIPARPSGGTSTTSGA
jgi:hypothetical protein